MYYSVQDDFTKSEVYQVTGNTGSSNQSGMGFIPLIIAGAVAIAGPLIAKAMEKKKKDGGISAKQMEKLILEAQQKEQQKYLQYGLIGGGVLLSGLLLYFVIKKKKASKLRSGAK